MENTRSTVFFMSVILSLVFAWFFIFPALQGIDSAQKAIELEQGDVELLREVSQQVQDAVSFFLSLSAEEKELIELAAPSNPDKVNAVVILDRLARENGLLVQDIKVAESAGRRPPSVTGNEQILGTLGVTLNLQGSYPSIKAFIVNAERTLRIFDIQSITISAGDEESASPGILTAEIVGDVYFTNMGN